MPEAPTLAISAEKIDYVAELKRRFDAKDALTNAGESSNPTDDDERAVLEDHRNDPVQREFVSFINSLDYDEQVDLVALAWLGRGDDTVAAWNDLRVRAADAHNEHSAQYLLGTPLLADLIEEGLAQIRDAAEDADQAMPPDRNTR